MLRQKNSINHYFVLVVILITTVLYLQYSSENTIAEDFKCLKCHKGKDSLEKYVYEKNIKTAEELRALIRKGPKAGLHLTSTDADIERAIIYLNLK